MTLNTTDNSFSYKRTVRRCGNSKSISLPPEVLESLNLDIGDEVEIFIDYKTKQLTVQKKFPHK